MEEKQFNQVGAMEGAENQKEEHPMSALMEDALTFRRLRPGDIVDGEIVSVTPTEVLVDVGAKSEGLVPSRELERYGREGLDTLQVGQTIPVYVVRSEDRDGNLLLSIRRAEEESDWRRAQKLFESGEPYETQVAGFNKGGLIARLGKLRGFVPASQLAIAHRGSDKQQPEERWSRLVGATIHVKIIELNRRRKRLILSERAAERLMREAKKGELLESLRPGEVRRGIVSSLADFGAFVDLGGADGLVHVSELSWNRSAKPRDVVDVGQEVEVYVLNVDQQKKRIALSLKRLEPEPWTTVESRYYVGQLVEGKVTRLANFGAFALVNSELEGLIHISELSNERINHPQDVVSEGEQHVMRIIRIDPKRRRMGLSLKRVTDPAYADLDWQAELAEAQATFEADDEPSLEEAAIYEAEELVKDRDLAEEAEAEEETPAEDLTAAAEEAEEEDEGPAEDATAAADEAEEEDEGPAEDPAAAADEAEEEDEGPAEDPAADTGKAEEEDEGPAEDPAADTGKAEEEAEGPAEDLTADTGKAEEEDEGPAEDLLASAEEAEEEEEEEEASAEDATSDDD